MSLSPESFRLIVSGKIGQYTFLSPKDISDKELERRIKRESRKSRDNPKPKNKAATERPVVVFTQIEEEEEQKIGLAGEVDKHIYEFLKDETGLPKIWSVITRFSPGYAAELLREAEELGIVIPEKVIEMEKNVSPESYRQSHLAAKLIELLGLRDERVRDGRREDGRVAWFENSALKMEVGKFKLEE